jgi:3-methyladenine DNA glycosylase AlkD
MADSKLLQTLRRELRAAGDPERARGAQAYMKSTMPFHGVGAVPMRAICKRVFAGVALPDAATWRREVLGVFRGARFREEQYAAVELCADKRARPFQTMDALPMYEEMITTGAWWDVVDALASHRLCDLLRHDPRAMKKAMLAWSKDADMWKARSAILCQIRQKEATDLKLLYACIAPSIPSREFFLRKAIGWALRSYAWTDPAEVQRYVAAHPELSGLSVREALKNVGKGARR